MKGAKMMLQIVIKLSKEQYDALCMKGVVVLESQLPSFLYALRRGIVLPKGHGRLIDVSNLLTVTDIRSDGSEFTYVSYSEIDDAPTIIEADKEREKNGKKLQT